MTPRIRVRYAEGLDIDIARSSGIGIDGDRLVRTSPDGTTVLGPVADVRAVRWLDGRASVAVHTSRASRLLNRMTPIGRGLTGPHGEPPVLWSGSCVVVGTHGPMAAWLVAETSGSASLSTRPEDLVAEQALAYALGTVLEPWEGAVPDAAVVRAVTLRAHRRDGRAVALASVLTLVALAASGAGFRSLDGQLGWPFALLAVGLAVPLAVASALDRARALRLVTSPPDPGERAVFRPGTVTADDPRQLQVGRHDVVVVPGDGSELWLPGPDVPGGVVRAERWSGRLSLTDGRGAIVHTLRSDWLSGEQDSTALRAAFDHAGLDHAGLDHAGLDGAAADEAAAARPAPSRLSWGAPSTAAGDLSPVQPWLMWFIAPMTIIAGLASTDDVPVVGWVVVVGGALVLALRTWCWWVWRGWLRTARRRGAIE